MASILADHQYTLDDFRKIHNRLNPGDCHLSSDVIQTINRIAALVGAPTYQRTPVFKNNTNNNNNGPRRERRRQKVTITASDWEEMRNFKTTTTIGNTEKKGIEKQLTDLQTVFNCMTSKNYDEKQEKVKSLLKEILDTNPEESELMKVGKTIFEIGSMNKFWAELYAKSYKGLIDVFPLMQSICEKNVESFIELFNNIRFVDSEKNYDEFCAVNKENSKRRALSSFFVHLMKQKVISYNKIIEIIELLINKFNTYIDEDNRKNEVDEISENLVIMIGNGLSFIEEHDADKYEKITEFVSKCSSLKARNHSSLSSKTVFKFMDLDDDC
jgi:hypothetical protein